MPGWKLPVSQSASCLLLLPVYLNHIILLCSIGKWRLPFYNIVHLFQVFISCFRTLESWFVDLFFFGHAGRWVGSSSDRVERQGKWCLLIFSSVLFLYSAVLTVILYLLSLQCRAVVDCDGVPGVPLELGYWVTLFVACLFDLEEEVCSPGYIVVFCSWLGIVHWCLGHSVLWEDCSVRWEVEFFHSVFDFAGGSFSAWSLLFDIRSLVLSCVWADEWSGLTGACAFVSGEVMHFKAFRAVTGCATLMPGPVTCGSTVHHYWPGRHCSGYWYPVKLLYTLGLLTLWKWC